MKYNALILELTVTNYSNSLRFYNEILGFVVEYTREEEGFAFLSYEGSQIMIDQIDKGRTWKTGEMRLPFGKGINLQINASNLDVLLGSLSKNNITLFRELEVKTYNTKNGNVRARQFLVQDPDGYLLRFSEE